MVRMGSPVRIRESAPFFTAKNKKAQTFGIKGLRFFVPGPKERVYFAREISWLSFLISACTSLRAGLR